MTTPDCWPDGKPVTPWADPWHDVAADLRALSFIVAPLPPDELERRARPYREAGTVTPEMIERALRGPGAGV
jgi:hypothetical protein